jgi:predicted neutral ceramidase superfamily lipid hydrolase
MELVNKFNKYFSKQAKLAILGYVLLSIAFFLPINNAEEEHIKYNLTERMGSFLTMLLPISISVYTINCMVVGVSSGGMPCNVLAWVNSLSVVVWSTLVLLFTLMLLNTTNNVEKYSCKKKNY